MPPPELEPYFHRHRLQRARLLTNLRLSGKIGGPIHEAAGHLLQPGDPGKEGNADFVHILAMVSPVLRGQ